MYFHFSFMQKWLIIQILQFEVGMILLYGFCLRQGAVVNANELLPHASKWNGRKAGRPELRTIW